MRSQKVLAYLAKFDHSQLNKSWFKVFGVAIYRRIGNFNKFAGDLEQQ